jgi:hypothetical protein
MFNGFAGIFWVEIFGKKAKMIFDRIPVFPIMVDKSLAVSFSLNI